MRKRKNDASVWIMVTICQSGESDHVGGFLSLSGSCEIVPVNSFAAGTADDAAVAFFEGSACSSSNWAGSYCYYYSLHHHVGIVLVESSPAPGL